MKNKAILLGAIYILAVGILSACATAKKDSASETKKAVLSEYKKLTPEDAKKRMEENSDLIIVDVRSQEEYDEGHIGNAIVIPVGTIGDKDPEMLPDKDAEILVYCRSGVRSKQAAEKLLELGYTNIIDIGGIIDWPYETAAQ